MHRLTPIMENLPASVETQLLRDMQTIDSRISDLVGDSRRHLNAERTLILLLELALTMESTFALWCWCHVHLDQRRGHGFAARISLRGRAEAAVEDADRIAECLQQITGSAFRPEWLPSASTPFSTDGFRVNSSIRDHIAI